ncbi:hypothetical protein [Mycolicibacterium peregrinum]|uniref:hypothetical protein n=1 Tax=Mycolicibacterium peregrinum TaxID=43304 RepID=UPI003AAC1FE1
MITLDDLLPFAPDIDPARAAAMIADALALARSVAPCLDEPEFPYGDAAKAILRGAILRWNDSGDGAAVALQADVFSATHDTRLARRTVFWPSEIRELSGLCHKCTNGAYWIDAFGPRAARRRVPESMLFDIA